MAKKIKVRFRDPVTGTLTYKDISIDNTSLSWGLSLKVGNDG